MCRSLTTVPHICCAQGHFSSPADSSLRFPNTPRLGRGGKASKEVEKEQPVRWDKKPRRAWCPGSQENNKEEEGVIKNITKCCREIKTRVKRNPLCSVLCGQIQLEGGHVFGPAPTWASGAAALAGGRGHHRANGSILIAGNQEPGVSWVPWSQRILGWNL